MAREEDAASEQRVRGHHEQTVRTLRQAKVEDAASMYGYIGIL